jgi:hypothetical protein
MLNMYVDAVVREWLHQMLGGDVARQGIGDEVAKWCVAFYIDGIWLQSSFDILVGLFERIGLFTNAAKTKAMMCAYRGGLEKVIQMRGTHDKHLGWR